MKDNNNNNVNFESSLNEKPDKNGKRRFKKFMDLPDTKGNIYFCLDIETTGLEPKEGEIVELFYRIMRHIPNTLNDWEVVKEEHRLFWSDDWWKTKDIHEIKEEELKGKPKFNSKENKEFRDELKNLFYHCINPNDPLVFMAQYAPFELNWMYIHLGLDEEDLNKIKVYDTRSVENRLFPDLSHSLIPMCERRKVGFPEGQHDFHRADQDVHAMFEVAKQQFLEWPK